MKSEIGISFSGNSILLDGTCEEDDGFMETYSYLFHLTVISDNPGIVGSIGNFLWNNAKSPHSWHLLPPTRLLLKNTFSGFLLHSIIEIKSYTV